MITNQGKQLLRKYLIGMTPAFATHISIGCGSDPLSDIDPVFDTGNIDRSTMKFEMARAPIVSRGLVYENGVRKLAFLAELPITNRYQITEVGVWSGAKNLRAAQFDSKTLTSFDATSERWFTITDFVSTSAIDIIPSGVCVLETGTMQATGTVFSCPNDSDIWVNFEDRKTRFEAPRFYNSSILVRGNYTNITYSGSVWTEGGTSNYAIETSSIGANMSKNSGDDEIRFAFSIAPISYGVGTLPDRVNIWLEFVNNFGSGVRKFAIAKASLDTDTFDSHYHVHTFLKSDFVIESGFSWSSINGIRLRTSLQDAGVVTGNWYVVHDGIRLENVTSDNPTYGLIAYTQVTTPDTLPALKTESTNNYIEFRMEVDSE